MALKIDGRDANVTSPRGTSVGIALPAHVGPFTAAFGLAVYMPNQVHRAHPARARDRAAFALLDNNLQHVVAQPVVALRFGHAFAIGAGASILADAAGNGVTFDVGITNGNKVGQAALDVTLPIRPRPSSA